MIASIPGRKGMLMSTSGKQKKPRPDFMKRKSQQQAMMLPSPKAWPLMAAMTGMGKVRIRTNILFRPWRKSLMS